MNKNIEVCEDCGEVLCKCNKDDGIERMCVCCGLREGTFQIDPEQKFNTDTEHYDYFCDDCIKNILKFK